MTGSAPPVLVVVDRVITGQTALHRRVRREFMLAVVIVSAVVIFRTIASGPGNVGPSAPLPQEDPWAGPAIPGNAVKGPEIGAFPIPGLRDFPDKSE